MQPWRWCRCRRAKKITSTIFFRNLSLLVHCLALGIKIRYMLVMQRFWVVYHGISHFPWYATRKRCMTILYHAIEKQKLASFPLFQCLCPFYYHALLFEVTDWFPRLAKIDEVCDVPELNKIKLLGTKLVLKFTHFGHIDSSTRNAFFSSLERGKENNNRILQLQRQPR